MSTMTSHLHNNDDDPEKKHDDDDDEERKESSSSPEAAGVVRGVSPSVQTVARGVARRSAVGRLPQRVIKRPKGPSLSVKRVARVSDRISTSWDVVSSALESEDDQVGSKKKKTSKVVLVGRRMASFAGTLMKNTLLGTAVFETYEFTVSNFASKEESLTTDKTGGNNDRGSRPNNCGEFVSIAKDSLPVTRSNNERRDDNRHDDDVDDFFHATSTTEGFRSSTGSSDGDLFARTTIPHHFFAGALAGSIHSIASFVLDGATAVLTRQGLILPSSVSITTVIPAASWGVAMTAHHAVAHSVLFGTYELTKRRLLLRVDDALFHYEKEEEERMVKSNIIRKMALPSSSSVTKGPLVDELFGIETTASGDGQTDTKDDSISHSLRVRYSHLAAVATAGGLAGQVQHVISHYTETWLGMNRDWLWQPVSPTSLAKKRPSDVHTPSSPVTEGGATSSKIRSLKTVFKVLSVGCVKHLFVPFPTLRSTILAFPPSAIGFMAFEYGKELVAR